MNVPNLEAPKLDLNRNPGGQPLNVDMERFFEFSFWIAEELLDLVSEHRPHFELVNSILIDDDIRLAKSDRFGGLVN